MRMPSSDVLDYLRREYPKGTRIKLISMDDPYSKLQPGTLGTVDFVDDMGTMHTNWDSGSRLGIVYMEDSIEKVAMEENDVY